jgi:hypothetical protein
MLIIAMALVQVATPPATAVPVPPAPLPQAAREVPIPMTQGVWASMTEAQRRTYADVTIQGLRRNARLSRCAALTPENLVARIDAEPKIGEALISTITKVVYEICPDA